MRVYLAAAFSRREEMEGYATRINEAGHEVVARWVFGGEEGLTRPDIALLDLEDVDRCDVILSFTHPRGTLTSRGGRHVEFGYALAKGKELHLISHRENVFHHHHSVQVFADLDEWITHHDVIK